MKDNKLLEAVETHIIGRLIKPTNLPSLMDIEDQSNCSDGLVQKKVRFQIRYTAMATLSDNYSESELRAAKEEVVKMYEREIYKSIRDQVYSPLQELRQNAIYRNDVITADMLKEIYDAIF